MRDYKQVVIEQLEAFFRNFDKPKRTGAGKEP
jgi:hypothetical protein